MKTDIVESKIKCSCGSKTIYLIELWKDHMWQFEQNEGLFDRSEGIAEPGNPYKVEAECRACGKIWTVRGALQISDCLK